MRYLLLATFGYNLAGIVASSHDSIGTNPFTYLNLGVLGVITWAWMTNRIFTKDTVERLILERDKADSTKDTALKELSDRVIPLAEQYNQQLIPALKDLNTVLPKILAALERTHGQAGPKT